jgi:hypothetical protein
MLPRRSRHCAPRNREKEQDCRARRGHDNQRDVFAGPHLVLPPIGYAHQKDVCTGSGSTVPEKYFSGTFDRNRRFCALPCSPSGARLVTMPPSGLRHPNESAVVLRTRCSGGQDEIEIPFWHRSPCFRRGGCSLDRGAGLSPSVAPGVGSPLWLLSSLLSDIRLRTGLRLRSRLCSFARQPCVFGQLRQSSVSVLPPPLVLNTTGK